METPDPHQQKAIDCERNAVVTAGAGSGKTTVLAQRYLRLIKEKKAGVENILTLTFTRKAASEMHARIYKLLRNEKQLPAVGKELEHFEQAQIATIDSFCSQIAKNWSQRFGIVRDFTIDENQARELMEQVSLDFLLRHQANLNLQEFIVSNGFETVWKKFFVSLAERYIHLAEEKDFLAMHQEQERKLRQYLNLHVDAATALFSRISALDPGAGKSIKTAREAVDSLPDITDLVRAEGYTELAERLSRFKLRKSSGKSGDLLVFGELVDELRKEINSIIEIALSLVNREITFGLMQLCQEFQLAVLEAKRNSGVLYYHDVIHMAIRTLLENQELRTYYKRRFKYIMIDEFQDNNNLQKNLLFLLSEKPELSLDRIPRPDELERGKLFFVGDEKQSIYLFRGADVSVFKQLFSELAETGGASLELPKNYRSEPDLIDFYNTVFPHIMKDARELYEAEYSKLISRERNADIDPVIKILYKPFPQEEQADTAHGDDAEAYAVGRRIKEIVENQTLSVMDGKQSRPARYGDIALLMRSTSNQIRYERVLRSLGIPYSVENVRSLFLEAPLNDLYAILQIAIYPEDRNAYAALLRSPFVNVSDTTMISILMENAAPFSITEDLFDSLPEKDKDKLAAAKSLYRFVQNNADKMQTAELIFHLWYTFGYRYTLLKRSEYHPYLEYYEYFRELALSADRRGQPLSVFLDFLRPNLGLYERIPDLEILKAEQQGVRIMTIHKAKGLEFPIVFLANSGNRGRSRDSSEPYYISDSFGLTMNTVSKGPGKKRVRTNYFYAAGKTEADQKELAELKRLLYVALTRAQYHLFISGCHNRQNRNSEGVFLNQILAALGWQNDSQVEDNPMVEIIPDIPDDLLYRRISSVTTSPSDILRSSYDTAEAIIYSFRREEWTATEIEEIAGKKAEYPVTDALPEIESDNLMKEESLEAVFGTLCHYVLQKSIENSYSAEAIPSSVRSLIPDPCFIPFLQDAELLTNRFLESPFGRELQRSAKIETEVPFIYRLDQNSNPFYINGQIDIIFEMENEIRIIDFKTDRYIRQGEYYTQMQIYRLAASEWSKVEPRCFLYFLRGQKAVEAPPAGLPELLI